MFGYIYNKENKIIVTKITNITACNNTTIKGDSLAVLGTGEYIITDIEYNEGDILSNEVIDKKSEINKLY